MASKGINKVILIGYLGQGPGYSLYAKRWRCGQHCAGHLRNPAGQTDREMREQTEWHRGCCSANWRKPASEYPAFPSGAFSLR